VDRARWPGTVQEAEPVLQSMPKRLVGQTRQVYVQPAQKEEGEAYGANGGVAYGEVVSLDLSEEYVTYDTASGKPELFHANNLLAAGFGLGLACAKGSYAGTAPQHDDFPGPEVIEKPLPRPVWFSCRIDGAEGDESYTGQAVGWTSGKTAWLVVGRDKRVVRKLVTALHRATR